MKSKSVPLKSLCILAILGCAAGALWAGPTTSYQAQKVVTGWLKTGTEPLGMVLGNEVERVETFTNNHAETIYYIVYLQPAGFVIVPADDLIEPIIGFVPVGLYNPSFDNPLGALVSRDLNGRIAAVRSTQGLKSSDVTAALLKAQDKWRSLTDLGEGGVFVKAGLATISEMFE